LRRSNENGQPRIGVLGAGQFARRWALPALARSGVTLHTIVSRSGQSAARAARRFGFIEHGDDPAAVLGRDDIDCVVVLTRHDSHGHLAQAALEQGKHVFVEKPLTLREDELDRMAATMGEVGRVPGRPDGRVLSVGFNRRFSRHTRRMRSVLRARSKPLTAIYTVNAGTLSAGHWALDPREGGGRIRGEACHFVDLLRHLVGEPVVEVSATGVYPADTRGDEMSIALGFADGSRATVHYLTSGTRWFPKERLEVFNEGTILRLEDFRRLRILRKGVIPPLTLPRPSALRRDKGHAAGYRAFVDAIRDGAPSPIPFTEIENATRATLAAPGAAADGRRVRIP